MERPVQITLNGATIEALSVGFKTTEDGGWSEFLLDDGTTFRVRPVVVDIARLPGQYDQNGNPVYVASVQNAVSILNVPANLRRSE